MDLRRPFKTVTPTLDGDVLAVLAGADADFTGRGVHGMVGGASERGVRNALDRLVEQGVVHSRPVGASKLYRLNRDHLAAPAIEALASLRAELLRRLADVVGAWQIKPVLAIVFGSVARGEADEGSDLDLLVVRPRGAADDPAWEAQLDDLQRQATAWTGNDTRILEYGELELDRASSSDRVVRAAMRDGVRFFEGGGS
jgi:predicted nucleotidyltransferase